VSLVLSVFGSDVGEVAITIPFKRLDLSPHSGHGTFHNPNYAITSLKPPMSKQEQSSRQDEVNLPLINPNAAGIDIGADRHWVSVPVGRDKENVRSECLFYSRLI
jgi:hypothetical protein